MTPGERSRAHALGVGLFAVTSIWGPWIDRLEISKLLVGSICALGVGVYGAVARWRVDLPTGIVLATSGAFWLASPASRLGFEAWLVPWLAFFFWWSAGISRRQLIVRWVLVAAALQAGLAILGVAGDPFGLAAQVSFRGRTAVGTLGNPTVLATWLAACFPVCFALPRAFGLSGAALVATAVFLTGSRVATGLVVFAALAVWRWSRPEGVSRVALGAALASGAAGVFALRGVSLEPWAERWGVIRVSLRGFSSSGAWWWGLGPEAFAHYWPDWRSRWGGPELSLRHAHFDPLEWWIELGLVGLLVWTVPVLVLVTRFGAFDRVQRYAAIGSLVLFTSSLFQPTLVFLPGALLAAALFSVALPCPMRAPGSAMLGVTVLCVGITTALVAQRWQSESLRSAATHARGAGAPSLRLALAAVERDRSNERAWLEVLMSDGASVAMRRIAVRELEGLGVRQPDFHRSESEGPRRPDSHSRDR